MSSITCARVVWRTAWSILINHLPESRFVTRWRVSRIFRTFACEVTRSDTPVIALHRSRIGSLAAQSKGLFPPVPSAPANDRAFAQPVRARCPVTGQTGRVFPTVFTASTVGMSDDLNGERDQAGLACAGCTRRWSTATSRYPSDLRNYLVQRVRIPLEHA
jgi:hypothetical protein